MVALFMFVLIWLIPLLLTIALASSVRPADKCDLAEKKVSWYLKKTIYKTDNHSILVMIIKCGTDGNIKVLNN